MNIWLSIRGYLWASCIHSEELLSALKEKVNAFQKLTTSKLWWFKITLRKPCQIINNDETTCFTIKGRSQTASWHNTVTRKEQNFTMGHLNYLRNRSCPDVFHICSRTSWKKIQFDKFNDSFERSLISQLYCRLCIFSNIFPVFKIQTSPDILMLRSSTPVLQNLQK